MRGEERCVGGGGNGTERGVVDISKVNRKGGRKETMGFFVTVLSSGKGWG